MKVSKQSALLVILLVLLMGVGTSATPGQAAPAAERLSSDSEAAAFLQDSSTVIVGDNEGLMVAWDVKRGQAQAVFRGHNAAITAIAVSPQDFSSPNAPHFASGTVSGELILWDFRTREDLLRLELQAGGSLASVDALYFSPDGSLLYAGLGGRTASYLAVIELGSGEILALSALMDERPRRFAMNAERTLLAVVAFDGEVLLWDVVNQQEAQRISSEQGYHNGVFDPAGERLILIDSGDFSLVQLDLTSGELRPFAAAFNFAFHLSVAADEGSLVVGGSPSVVIDAEGQVRQRIRIPARNIEGVVISPDGSTVLVQNRDFTPYLVTVESGAVQALAFVPTVGASQGNIVREIDTIDLLGFDTSDWRGLAVHQDQFALMASAGLLRYDFATDSLSMLLDANPTYTRVAISADGSFAIVGNSGGFLFHLTLESANFYRFAALHDGEVVGVAISPDANRVYSLGRDNRLLLHSAEGESLAQIALESEDATVLALSHAGDMVAVGGCSESSDAGCVHSRIWLYDSKNLSLLRSWGLNSGRVFDLSFSADDSLIFSAGSDGKLRGWAPWNGGMVWDLIGHEQDVIGVRALPDGRIVSAACYAHAGSYCVQQTLIVWEVETGSIDRQFYGYGLDLYALGAGGNFAVTGGTNQLRVWDIRAFAPPQEFREREAPAIALYTAFPLQSLGINSQNQVLANTAWLDLNTGQRLGSFSDDGHPAVYSPDGTWLAMVEDAAVFLLNPLSEERRRIVASRGLNTPPISMAFAPDGTRLAVGYHSDILIIDIGSGDILQTLELPSDASRALAWHPQSSHLAGAGAGGAALWDVNSGELRQSFDLSGGAALHFSGDGNSLFIAAHDPVLAQYDNTTGELMQVLQGHGGWVQALILSPDGTMLYSAGTDRSVIAWDAFSGAMVARFGGHLAAVNALALRPDGRLLLSGSADGFIRLWPTERGTFLHDLLPNAEIFGVVDLDPLPEALALPRRERYQVDPAARHQIHMVQAIDMLVLEFESQEMGGDWQIDAAGSTGSLRILLNTFHGQPDFAEAQLLDEVPPSSTRALELVPSAWALYEEPRPDPDTGMMIYGRLEGTMRLGESSTPLRLDVTQISHDSATGALRLRLVGAVDLLWLHFPVVQDINSVMEPPLADLVLSVTFRPVE